MAATGLALAGAPLWGLGALVLAALALRVIHRLLSQLASREAHQLLLDERLLQAQKLAALGELSAGVAHEINNPLAIIRQEAEWMQQLLKKAPALPEVAELKDSLREILQQVERSGEITHNLLNLARKREPVLQEVDLNSLIESMARLVEKETIARQIELIRDYQPNLPRTVSDPPLLRQVILNLLNNARQALDGPGTITVVTRLADQEHLEVSVRDTGRGIPPDHLDKVFEPFFTTKPPGQGTGLGLALCHSIVHKLGGDIRVMSRVGQGTTFTIRLPLKCFGKLS